MRAYGHLAVTAAIAMHVGACALEIPDMGEPGGSVLQQSFTEMDLVNHIKCEIHLGVREALRVWKPGGPAGGNGVEWLRAWQAKVSLKLTVDDTTSLNPGLNFTQPMKNAISYFAENGNVVSPQSFSLGLGLQASAQATRAETLAFTYRIADLLKYDPLPPEAKNCNGHGRVPVVGTLKIDEFIVSKAGIAASPDTVPNTGVLSPFTVFNHQTTFVLTFGGSATPVWKLIHVTANATSPFFNAIRKRTQDVTITMGPVNSAEVTAIFQASITAQALAAALQNQR